MVLEGQQTPPETAVLELVQKAERELTQAQATVDRGLGAEGRQEDTERQGEASLEELDLGAEAQHAIDRAQVRAQSPPGHLNVHRPCCPAPVRANRTLLRRVLDNLIENAVRYSKAAPEVTIEVDAGNSHRPFVRVIDRGVGMTPAIASKIFQRGFRAKASTDRRGLGLGLWLSARAAEQMQATLELESSQPGRGSVFRLELQPVTK